MGFQSCACSQSYQSPEGGEGERGEGWRGLERGTTTKLRGNAETEEGAGGGGGNECGLVVTAEGLGEGRGGEGMGE